MSERLFGRDVRASAEMAIALVNTSPRRNGDEGLTTTSALAEMGHQRAVYYHPDGSQAELVGMRRLRDRLDEIVSTATVSHRFAMLNELFYSAAAIPQIVMHDPDPYPHFHYTLEDAPYVDHIKGVTAYALSRLIIMDEWDRLRNCARPGCHRLFFDTTRNGGRLYCDSQTCGNVVHTARYRTRRARSLPPRDSGADRSPRGIEAAGLQSPVAPIVSSPRTDGG